MVVVSIEKYARDVPEGHARQVEAYSLGRFMDGLHSEQESRASEADRGGDGGKGTAA
jgi:hypothetical protein